MFEDNRLEILKTLDNLNSENKLNYSDYLELHDLISGLNPAPIHLEWFHDRGFTYAKPSKYCIHYKLDLRNMMIFIYKGSLDQYFEVLKYENEYDPTCPVTPIGFLKDKAQQHFNKFVKELIQ